MSQTHIFTHPGRFHVVATATLNQSVTHHLDLASRILLHREADAFSFEASISA